MNAPPESVPCPTNRLKELGERLTQALRLRTLPFAMKLFEDPASLDGIPGLRRPRAGRRYTTCQLVTQCRISGFTLGVTSDHLIRNGNCGGVVGLDHVGEAYLSGRKMAGVWFENVAAACAHQQHMPRVPAGRYHALGISPLRSARLDEPDIVLFYASPAQAVLFVNGLQWKNYRRYDFTMTGESACADSWGRALATRQTSISIPCYAERRYGGVADDEMLVALPPDEFERGIEGLESLSKVGLRYPIPPYGIAQDPAEGLSVSYGS
jgi:uncharacterized protein (DUF169 family)